MANQHNPTQPTDTHPPVITVSSDDIKAIFGDNDIAKLEYPADEFPSPQTRIILTFTERSGKKPQYIELQEWLELLENYRERQKSGNLLRHLNDTQWYDYDDTQQYEHGEEFVCMISYRVNGDKDNAGEAVVNSEDRDDYINTILEKHPHDQLDFSTEFMCKRCFEEMLSEQLEESIFGGLYAVLKLMR